MKRDEKMIHLRPAAPGDHDRVAELITTAFAEEEYYLRWLFPRSTQKAHDALPFIRYSITESLHNGHILCAYDDEDPDTILGAAVWEHISLYPECVMAKIRRSLMSARQVKPIIGSSVLRYVYEDVRAEQCRTIGEQCYLHCLAVDASARGRGIARILISHPPVSDIPVTLECREPLRDFYRHLECVPLGRHYCLPGVGRMYAMSYLPSISDTQ